MGARFQSAGRRRQAAGGGRQAAGSPTRRCRRRGVARLLTRCGAGIFVHTPHCVLGCWLHFWPASWLHTWLGLGLGLGLGQRVLRHVGYSGSSSSSSYRGWDICMVCFTACTPSGRREALLHGKCSSLAASTCSRNRSSEGWQQGAELPHRWLREELATAEWRLGWGRG